VEPNDGPFQPARAARLGNLAPAFDPKSVDDIQFGGEVGATFARWIADFSFLSNTLAMRSRASEVTWFVAHSSDLRST
jgi:hypothetical protein